MDCRSSSDHVRKKFIRWPNAIYILWSQKKITVMSIVRCNQLKMKALVCRQPHEIRVRTVLLPF